MRQEMLEIVKGIMIVIGITTATIFVCLRVLDQNYIYFINYYQGDNKYEIKITDSYKAAIDVSVICKEDKCVGQYIDKISVNVNVSKEDVKALINEFALKKNVILETNEARVSDTQKKLLLKFIR